MHIGVLHLEFTLHGSASLKDKRNVARSLKQKLRNKFNVAVAEVGNLDNALKLTLTVATVGGEYKHVEGRLTKALNMVEAAATEELTDSWMELFTPDEANPA